jgi:hypothetical protein
MALACILKSGIVMSPALLFLLKIWIFIESVQIDFALTAHTIV